MQKRLYCTCSRSKCQNKYCICLNNNINCKEYCKCQECQNNLKALKQEIPQNNPFFADFQKLPKKCKCKKSFCIKKYCECFQAGTPCTDACKCENCKNKGPLNQGVVQKKPVNKPQAQNLDHVQLHLLNLRNENQDIQPLGQNTSLSSLNHDWLASCAQQLFDAAQENSVKGTMKKLMQILNDLAEGLENKQIKGKPQQLSQKFQEDQGQNSSQQSFWKRPRINKGFRKYQREIPQGQKSPECKLSLQEYKLNLNEHYLKRDVKYVRRQKVLIIPRFDKESREVQKIKKRKKVQKKEKEKKEQSKPKDRGRKKKKQN